MEGGTLRDYFSLSFFFILLLLLQISLVSVADDWCDVKFVMMDLQKKRVTHSHVLAGVENMFQCWLRARTTEAFPRHFHINVSFDGSSTIKASACWMSHEVFLLFCTRAKRSLLRAFCNRKASFVWNFANFSFKVSWVNRGNGGRGNGC